MSQTCYYLISVFILSFSGLRSIYDLSIRKNWFDIPVDRSSHNRIIPRTAGIPIFLISLVTIFILDPLEFKSIFIYLAYFVFFLLGIFDDFTQIRAKYKFLTQLIIAFILAGFLPQLRIDNFYGVLGIFGISEITSVLFTSFVFIVIINAYNLIDGIDGLAATFGIFAFLLLGYVFLKTNQQLFYLCIFLSVILIPFYFFNLSTKRKMFLGDTGSLFLGLTIALLVGIVLNTKTVVHTPFNMNRALFALVSLCYPLLDTLRVFTLRLAKGQSPFTADRQHLHHKLLGFGLNHFTTTFALLVFNICIFIINATSFKNVDVNAVLITNFIIIAAFFITGQRVSIWFSKKAKN